jgi:signal transduction histidine kinase
LDKASNRLAEIIQEVITFVKIEAETNWEKQAFEWEKELLNLVHSLEEIRSKKQIEFKIQSKNKIKTLCDLAKTRLALNKILSDAIKRAPEKTSIGISLTEISGKIMGELRRKGEAIDEKAFSPLEITGNVLHHHKNLGLELPVSRLIFERQGGLLTYRRDPDAEVLCWELPIAKV